MQPVSAALQTNSTSSTEVSLAWTILTGNQTW